MAYNVIQWEYIQEMGQWSEDDLLISVDLEDGSYCNGAYGWPSNIRVAAEAGCETK